MGYSFSYVEENIGCLVRECRVTHALRDEMRAVLYIAQGGTRSYTGQWLISSTK
jgi:hypothetical protein